jgi:sec-independent protein translocase protein TatA
MPGLPTIGPFELLLVLILALLILGPGKLPEVGSALGKTIREFRRATTDVDAAAKGTDTSSSVPTPAEPMGRPPADEPVERDTASESRAPGH